MSGIYGKRRSISLQYRFQHVATGEVVVIYPGQLSDFGRCHNLNTNSLFARMSMSPDRVLNVYRKTEEGSLANKRHGSSREVVFKMFPQIDSSVRPPRAKSILD